MCRVLDRRRKKDEPKAVECSEMRCQEGMCNEGADHIVGEYSAEGKSVFPSWHRFPPLMDWKAWDRWGHGRDWRHFDILLQRVMGLFFACERSVCM